MYTSDDRLSLPDPDTVIWRFMPLPSLLSILQRKQLFFSAARSMQDPYDAKLPKSVMNQLLGWAGLATNEPRIKGRVTGDTVRHVIREGTCINCWHCNPVESAAMWSLYSPHHGVAVKSTVGRLIQAIQATSRSIQMGRIHYIDFRFPEETDSLFWTIPEFVKRKSFEHEQELRAVTVDLDLLQNKGTTGISVDIDIAVLIEEIYVSPTVEGWIKAVVEAELQLHGLVDTSLLFLKLVD
jgi:hypothetical protein